MKQPLVIKRFGCTLVHYRRDGVNLTSLSVGDRIYNLNAPVRALVRAVKYPRRFLPYFYAVGLRCCDHGGRVTRWYRAWGWNCWHMDRVIQRDWYGAGDGEVYNEISLVEYVRWLYRDWQERRADRREVA